MGDLISREFLQTAIHNFFNGLNHTPIEEDIQRYIEVAPSADIIDHARAIKEYCKNKGDDCTGCPFESKNKNACELGRMMLPSEWFLPEGEKGGAE